MNCTQPETMDITIDDKDPTRILYSPIGVWEQVDKKRFTGGSQHLTKVGGASFTVKFNGSYVWYMSDKDRIHGSFRVNLDDDVFVGSSRNDGYVDREVLFCKEVDQLHEHTMTISNLDDGQFFSVDSIIYRPVQPAGEPLTVKTTANSRRVHPGVYVGVVLFSLALILLVLLIFLVRRDNRKRAEYHRRMYAPAEPVDTARWAQFREPGSQSSIVSWRREPTAGGYAPTPT